MSSQTQSKVQALTAQDIMSVYSGKDGKCCCGCAGKHYTNSLHVELNGQQRGYEVSPKEINDKMVSKVLNLLKSNDNEVESLGTCYSLVVGTRLYVAYTISPT